MNRGHEYRSVLDFGNARKMYEAAAKIAPYVPAPHYFLYLVTMQSDKAFSRKEYAKFVALGSGKIRNPEKHCKAGLELIASGQYASAVIELERALRLDPENEQANSALLDAYGKLGYSRIWRGEIGWGETAGIAPGLKVKFAGMTGNRPYCGTFALGRSDGKMEASVYVQSGEWARTSLNGTEYVLVCHAIESHMDGSDSALVSVLQKN
jgi:tetratricopeptide (TPR) repeat protein